MSVLAILLAAMIPPALPPSGPIRGKLNCLLNISSSADEAWLTVNEDEADATAQVFLRGSFPLTADEIDHVSFEGGVFKVVGKDRSELYRFERATPGDGDGDWWKYRVVDKGGAPHDAGICFGRFIGRPGPVRLDRIQTFKVEVSQ